MADLKLALIIDAIVRGAKDVAGLTGNVKALGSEAAKKLPDNSEALRAGLRQASGDAITLSGAIKGLATAAVFREFIQANASLEGMTKALESVSGSSTEAQADMAFVRAEANRMGIEIGTAANSFVSLSASAKGTRLEGEDTRKIWSAVAESMARLGKSGADTQGALVAISQMMSKGTVASEELRGQLSERLPGAFQIAARAMGVSTAELSKMLEQGQVVSDDFLPKFAEELQKTFGGGNIDTFNSNLGRLKNTINDVFIAIGDTGIFAVLSGALKYVSVAVVTAWSGFELLGKTLANIAYTVATLDFSGYRARQQQALKEAREEVGKVIEKLFPLQTELRASGEAGKKAGEAISTGMKTAAKGLGDEMKKSIESAIKDYQSLANAAREAWQKSADAQKSYLAQAAALEAEANARPKDSSVEGQALALLDVIAAQEKLIRLQSQGAGLEDVQAQAKLVRDLAGGLDDQARAQEAVNQSKLIEAKALRAAAAEEGVRQEGLRQQWQQSEQIVKDLQTALEAIGKGTAIKIESDQAKAVLDDITSKLEALKDKTITVTVVPLSPTGQLMDNLSVPGKATGGPIVGPGGPTDDQVLMLGSNGEHMLTAAEVRAAGGHGAIYRLRQALLSRMLPRFAAGGAVGGASMSPRALGPTFPDLGRIELRLAGDSYPVYADAGVADALRRAVIKLGCK